jgi:hypothetical protein
MRHIYIILVFFIIYNSSSQEKFSEKKLKSTKEKLFFVNDTIQNTNFLYYDDYGHGGFSGPKGTLYRFVNYWENEVNVNYINNKKDFNLKGLLTKEVWFNKKDSLIAYYEYEYTNFDSLSKVKWSLHNDEYFNFINFNYNNKNRVESILKNSETDSEFMLQYVKYDSVFNVIKREHYEEFGYNYSTIYKFNENDLNLEISEHHPYVFTLAENGSSYGSKEDSIGVKYLIEKKHFNKKKQLIRHDFFTTPDYKTENNLNRYFEYEYDKNNNLILSKHSIVSSNYGHIKTKRYDKMNRLIYEKYINKYNDSLSLYHIKEYFYNNKNELLKLIIFENNIKTVVKYDYLHDKFNNWIEKTKIVNGKKLFICKRDIEYF